MEGMNTPAIPPAAFGRRTPSLLRRHPRTGLFLVAGLLLLADCSFFMPACRRTGDEYTVMTWNLENLFDDVRNGGEYADYVPGEETWTAEDFHGKMACLAQGVTSAVRGGPDVLLVQEIENLNCLEQFNTLYLKGMGYRYSALRKDPEQAVTTGVLSRYPLQEVYYHSYSLPESPSNRSILEVWVEFPGETVIILNNHWKSKLGGAGETEPVRRKAASLINRRIRELREEGRTLPVLVAGDLNENLMESSLPGTDWPTALIPLEMARELDEEERLSSLVFTGGTGPGFPFGEVLYSPWPLSPAPGSYHYGETWETIDHFLLSREFFDSRGLEYSGFGVNRPDFLLYPDGTPMRWSRSAGEGYSDHLALVLTLKESP